MSSHSVLADDEHRDHHYNHFPRHICSFVRRQGRFTNGQRQALQQLWPVMGVTYKAVTQPLDSLFGREAPLILEIGFGMGQSLVTMAQRQPHHNFLGIEVHLPGVGSCLAAANRAGVTNVRVVNQDAVVVLNAMIPDASLDRVQLFFPDPWPKARHHKRRLVQPMFTALLQRKLKAGGILHLATDWQPYAEQMLAVVQATPGYRNLAPSGSYLPRPVWRPLTKFEQRGERLGHGVWDLVFTCVKHHALFGGYFS